MPKKHEKNSDAGLYPSAACAPITFAHHMLAYFNMLQRDFRRLLGVWEGADMMPLGAGAIAGTTFPIDRFMVAEELNFGTVYPNSMDAVSDRDYIIEFLSFASTLMMHMSRLSEEICLWSSTEFGFVELDDAFATGSSMMPQKKNPDISELVRGKTGRVYGHLMAMLTTAKGLPLTYNKDLQEDKEGFFDAIDTVKFTLAVYRDMILTMTVNVDKMAQAVSKDFSNATDWQTIWYARDCPSVRHMRLSANALPMLFIRQIPAGGSLEEYKQFSDLFESDLLVALKPEHCVEARKSYGGPAFSENEKQFAIGDKVLAVQQAKLEKLQSKL